MRISPLTYADHALLVAATEAAHHRMKKRDRDSWPPAERHDGPVQIGVIIRAVLARLGLPMPSQEADRG